MIIKRVLYIVILFLFAFSAYSQKITWQRTDQSLDGNVNEIVEQAGTLFAGTVAGVYKSTDMGESWFLSNSGLDNTKVFALAVKNDDEIYCGTHNGVYYSSDKGATWVRRSEGITDNYITTIYIKDDSTLFAGTLYSGMFYTNNGGDSWVQVQGDFTDKAVNAIAIRESGHIYVGTTSALYRSDANGQNYIIMKNNLPQENNVYTITIRKNGIVYFGTRKGKVYRTIDNGNSWTLQLDIPEQIQIFSSLLTPNGALVITTYGNGVYRSNDNAETWEQINDGLTNLKVMTITQTKNGDFFAGTWGDGVFKGFEPPIITEVSGTYCAGDGITVSYNFKKGITFNPDNIFYVEISDETGSFGKPDTIGQIATTDEGIINCVLPEGLKTGPHNVRVVSGSPQEIGASASIFVHALPDTDFSGNLEVCENSMEQYGIPTRKDVRSLWFVQGGTIKSPATADTIDVQWYNAENAYIMLVRYNIVTNCSDTVMQAIKFNPTPEKPTITRMGNLLVSSSNTGNQWYSFGKLLQGETGKTLELKEPGIYTVQVTNQFGCVSEMSDEYDYNVNSVEDEQFADLVKIYPVPSQGYLTIEMNFENTGKINCSIYTLAGEIVYSDILGYSTTGLIKKLDLTTLSNGSYYLRIDNGKSTLVKKIIIKK